ncbi:hypothetical protein Sru01_46460 [Sphaerisporangium rufum]|uniref:Uncharacterized protein n=1 Tax=Sphaerisporangium rufum TaxID=1381558 RepID=A0A919V1E8_9ACTN|nr:hypothetical protein Sru01_46460 [Sphaerisporangium rufum]
MADAAKWRRRASQAGNRARARMRTLAPAGIRAARGATTPYHHHRRTSCPGAAARCVRRPVDFPTGRPAGPPHRPTCRKIGKVGTMFIRL